MTSSFGEMLSRDSEPQRVPFPVFVGDDLSLVPEKRPIQGLSKYQSSPKEKFNHRRRFRDRKVTAVLPA
jgi:hypothetical protein